MTTDAEFHQVIIESAQICCVVWLLVTVWIEDRPDQPVTYGSWKLPQPMRGRITCRERFPSRHVQQPSIKTICPTMIQAGQAAPLADPHHPPAAARRDAGRHSAARARRRPHHGPANCNRTELCRENGAGTRPFHHLCARATAHSSGAARGLYLEAETIGRL